MFTRQLPAILVTALLVSALLAACGSGVRVDPLIGDDEELLGYVETSVSDLHDYAPAIAAHKLYEALGAKDWEAAWALLSAETRRSLDALAARTASAPNGQSVLLQSFETGIPLERSDGKELRVEPLRWLLVADLAWFQRTLDPEVEPVDSKSETILYAIDANHDYRAVALRREEGTWRVHQPSFRFDEVAPLLSSAR